MSQRLESRRDINGLAANVPTHWKIEDCGFYTPMHQKQWLKGFLSATELPLWQMLNKALTHVSETYCCGPCPILVPPSMYPVTHILCESPHNQADFMLRFTM